MLVRNKNTNKQWNVEGVVAELCANNTDLYEVLEIHGPLEEEMIKAPVKEKELKEALKASQKTDDKK